MLGQLPMLSKQPFIMKSSIQIIFLFFCYITISCSALLFFSKAYADDNTTLDCLYCKPEIFKMFRFVDSKHHQGLQGTHESVCQLIKDGKWDRDTAHKFINKYVFRLGACRQTNVNPDYEIYLKKDRELPESVVLVHRYFCRETFDPTYQWRGEDYRKLSEKMDWLGIEVFCQVTHEMAYPSGFWENLFEPDLPSITKYQERVDSICQELRNDNISFNEAVYRWQQADIEFDKSLGPEMVKKMGRDLKKPIEILIDTFNTNKTK